MDPQGGLTREMFSASMVSMGVHVHVCVYELMHECICVLVGRGGILVEKDEFPEVLGNPGEVLCE